MGKKMYYTEEEAAERLGISADELADHVRDGKLRVFPDGMKKMYRVDQVDELAGGGDDVEEISLAEAEETEPTPKEDTVISSEGISIFDAEDLELEPADPMAKTQIVSSIEDQINLEGVGSGSGLLDLTRESDDTSLGAEVLDNIELEGAAVAESETAPPDMGMSPVAPVAPVEQVMISPTYVEEIDPMAGLFGGIVVGTAVMAIVLTIAALGSFEARPPSYLAAIKENIAIVIGVGVLVSAIGAVLGFLAGKASAARAAALRQGGM